MHPILPGRHISPAATGDVGHVRDFDLAWPLAASVSPSGQHYSAARPASPGNSVGTVSSARQTCTEMQHVGIQSKSVWKDACLPRLMSNGLARHFLYTGLLDQNVLLKEHKIFLDQVIATQNLENDAESIANYDKFIDEYKTQILKDYFSLFGSVHPEFSPDDHHRFIEKAESNLSSESFFQFEHRLAQRYRTSWMGHYFQKYHCIDDHISLDHHMQYVSKLKEFERCGLGSRSFTQHEEEYRIHFMALYFQKTRAIWPMESPFNHLKAIRYMKNLAVECHQDNQLLIEDYMRALAVYSFQRSGKIMKEIPIAAHRLALDWLITRTAPEQISPDTILSYQHQFLQRHFLETGDLAPEFSLDQHAEYVMWHLHHIDQTPGSAALLESYRLAVCDAFTQPLYLVQQQYNWRAELEEI